MTVVARITFKNGWPVMLGDLLLSGRPQRGLVPRIPTGEDAIGMFPFQQRVPSGLTQKVIILDNLMIGWAGQEVAARYVLKKLYARSARERFTLAAISDFLTDIAPDVTANPLQLTGFVFDEGKPQSFNFSCESSQIDIGEVVLLGTGAESARDTLGQLATSLLAPDSRPNDRQLSISAVLSCAGVLLGNDLMTGTGLRNFYGGGYELATVVDGRFQKIDDITYLFWTARVLDGGIGLSEGPRHVFSYGYMNDILVIRSVSIDHEGENTAVRQNGYVVPPPYRRILDKELNNIIIPSLNSRWLCHYIMVSLQSGEKGVLVQVDYRPDGQHGLRLNETRSGIDTKVLGFEAKKEYIENLAQRIFDQIPRVQGDES